jgi:hypothetical protein
MNSLWDMPDRVDEILALVTRINEKVEIILTEQADFNADIAALTTFLTDTLPAALTAIQTELAQRGITDLSSLDSLVNTTLPQVQSTLSTIVPAAPTSSSPTSSTPTSSTPTA